MLFLRIIFGSYARKLARNSSLINQNFDYRNISFHFILPNVGYLVYCSYKYHR